MDQYIDLICRISITLILMGGMATGLSHRNQADAKGGRVSRREDPLWFWICMSAVAPPMMLVSLLYIIQPAWLSWLTLELSPWLRLAGIPLGVLSIGLFHWMFHHLGQNVTPTSKPRVNATLITSGPYHFIRHPMYSFGLVLFLSISLLTASWYLALGGMTAFILLALRSRLEEQRLIDTFGENYKAYQRTTGRFLPKFFTST